VNLVGGLGAATPFKSLISIDVESPDEAVSTKRVPYATYLAGRGSGTEPGFGVSPGYANML
jgi:hypothetical protein